MISHKNKNEPEMKRVPFKLETRSKYQNMRLPSALEQISRLLRQKMQACIFWEVDKVFLKVLWDLDGTHIMARPRGACTRNETNDPSYSILIFHHPSAVSRRVVKHEASHTPCPRPPTASMSLLSHFIRVAAAPSFWPYPSSLPFHSEGTQNLKFQASTILHIVQ